MAAYKETEFLISKIAFQMLLLILIATDIFILICTQLDIGTEAWMFYIATIVFTVVILIFYFLRLHIEIDTESSKIIITYMKKRTIPFSDVIDHKTGDIDIIKNYSGWGPKNIRYKNYICHGYDRGISFKLRGRMIVTLSTSDPEAIASLVPKNPIVKETQEKS